MLFLAGRVGGGVSAAVEEEVEEIGFVVGRGGGSSNEATDDAAKGSVVERIGGRWGIFLINLLIEFFISNFLSIFDLILIY